MMIVEAGIGIDTVAALDLVYFPAHQGTGTLEAAPGVERPNRRRLD